MTVCPSPQDREKKGKSDLKTETKYFGLVEYEQGEVIHFPVGIPGFPDEKEFLLLPFADSSNMMLCLQSLTTPMLAFVLLDPFVLFPGYAPVLQEEELRQMGVESEEQLCFYVLCVLKTPVASSTVNLRCPIAIDPHTLEARQIVLDTDSYGMRDLLSSLMDDGGKLC